MIILLLFSFLAGIITILSPCILPVLPIVLTGSLTGGKRRPLGIVTGFICSFTFFTLFLATLVRLLGISADGLRLLSILIISGFGLSLLLPSFQGFVERLFTSLSSRVSSPSSTEKTGFRGGILIGMSLGLVWTPCVGPILASVISLALTGTVTGLAVFITFAYALGTAIPLLAITYGGRTLLQRFPFLVSRSGLVQKVFGVVMMLTAISMAFNLDRQFQTFILRTFPQYGIGLTALEDTATVREQLDTLYDPTLPTIRPGTSMKDALDSQLNTAPELLLDGQWFNSEPLKLSQLRGKVVLVDFWTYTCINCIRTLPYLKTWHEKYADNGLVIIGVHTPEFEFEKNSMNVSQAIQDFELPYPVMQDNNYRTWRAYSNRYWPAKYFIGKDGTIRSTHFGEGNYDESERIIQELLSEEGPVVRDEINNPTYQVGARTPELYLGYDRIEYLSSPTSISKNKQATYTAPVTIPPNHFAYTGKWTVGSEYAKPESGATLPLRFEAGEVFLVMRPISSAPSQVRVLLDNQPVESVSGKDVKDGVVSVTTDRLYSLIRLPSVGTHTLTLEFLDGNVELYAFTFG